MIRAFLLCLLLAACTAPVTEQPPDPLLFAPEDIGHAKEVVIGIPGALTSIKVFLPIEDWRSPGRTIAYYRLPGFDAQPDDVALSINAAASRLATFVRDGGFEEVYLIGHSTGAAIALETAKALRRVRPDVTVHIAGISTALPAPQPVLAGLRGAKSTVAAAARARSLRPRDVWIEYYRRLSYGRDTSKHLEVIAAANARIAAGGNQIELPPPRVTRRHFQAILGWQNIRPERLEGVEITFWHGAEDPVFPPRPVRRFVDTLPEAELRLLPHHGHVILLTYPEIWQDLSRLWGFEDG